MQAIELVRFALNLTDQGVARLVADLRDTPLIQPVHQDGRATGNHPIWQLGHLAFIEGTVAGVLFGNDEYPNPVAHWAPLFAGGSQPKPDAGLYPSFDEVLGKLRELRARNLQLLDRIGEAGLDRVPKDIPPGAENEMRTMGHTLVLIALHQMVHYGELADARRAAGHKPLM